MRTWLLGIGLLLTAIYLVAVFIDKTRKPTPAQVAAAEARKAERRARAERGPYIERTTQISDTETLSEVRIPFQGLGGDLAIPGFDRKCLIYRNSELRTAQMVCEGYSSSSVE